MRNLVILDDIFPVLLSAFRVAEYNHYLASFPNSVVVSSAKNFHLGGEVRPFDAVVRDYEDAYPALAGRTLHVTNVEGVDQPDSVLAYMLFLNNVYDFLPFIESNAIPFVFTLYPGGGLHLGQKETNDKLSSVLMSPCFRKVIVTQRIARDYLLENGFCDESKVELIYGGVSAERPSGANPPKLRYGFDKLTFDLFFMANKYMRSGADKGYDVFIETARLLARQGDRFRFHVAGPFGPEDYDISGLEGRIEFHGSLSGARMLETFSGMDVIVSPNAPDILGKGAFDGFPTGCCLEAGLSGVAIACTDPLNLNMALEGERDLLIIDRDPEHIASRIARFVDDPEGLRRLGELGRETLSKVFSAERQLAPRERILAEALAS